MNPGDLLARWMAETGRGSIVAFKTKFRWLADTAGLTPHTSDAGRWLRDTAALGHIEVDWEAGTWSAAPLVLTRVPAGDGLALICGLRTSVTQRLIDESDLATHLIEQNLGNGQLPRPSALFVQYDPGDDLAQLATSFRAAYVPCAAEQLGLLVPALSAGEATAPPALGNQTVEFYDAKALQWRPATAGEWETGAYRLTIGGRLKHRWFDSQTWQRADLPACMFLSLNRRGISALRWRRDSPRGRTGHLFVDFGAPLPPLVQRAAVLCSGFTPRFAVGAQTVAYENIPMDLARRIASAVQQRLDEMKEQG